MHEEARRILEYHLERIQHDYVPAVMVSAIYHGLGETDKALEWLELAFNEGIAPILLPDVIDGPKFRTLNNHPRFQALTAKVKQEQSGENMQVPAGIDFLQFLN